MWRGIWSLVTVLLCSNSWLQAAEPALSFFDGNVDVLIRLREPDQTIDQLADLVDKIQPGAGEGVRGQVALLGQSISNPALTGVDQSRDWYVGVYADAEAPPTLVFAIPAVNTDDLVSALPEGTPSLVKGDWVIYTDAEALIAPASEAATAEQKVTGQSLEFFKKGNLSAYVNIQHLVEVYDSQLETAQDTVLEQLNNLRFQQNPSNLNLDGMVEFYSRMAEVTFRGLAQADAACVAVTADENGVAIEKLVVFQEGTEIANQLGTFPPSTLPLLQKLPEGELVYFGAAGFIPQMMRAATEMSYGLMLTDQSRQEQLQKLLADLDNVKMTSTVGSMRLEESAHGLLQISAIAEAEPIDAIRNYLKDSMELLQNLKVPGVTQTTTMVPAGETIDGKPVDLITVVQEFDPAMDPMGIQTKMRDVLIGPNGQTSRIVYLQDRYCQTTGGGPDVMTNLLQSLESSGKNGLQSELKTLYPDLNSVMLMDIPGLIAVTLKEISKSGQVPIPINEQMIDNLYLRRSYVAFAATTEKGILKHQVRIPVDQIQGFAKLGILFASLQQQRF